MSEFLDRLKKCIEEECKERPGAKRIRLHSNDWQRAVDAFKVSGTPECPWLGTPNLATAISVVADDSFPEDLIRVEEWRWY